MKTLQCALKIHGLFGIKLLKISRICHFSKIAKSAKTLHPTTHTSASQDFLHFTLYVDTGVYTVQHRVMVAMQAMLPKLPAFYC